MRCGIEALIPNSIASKPAGSPPGGLNVNVTGDEKPPEEINRVVTWKLSGVNIPLEDGTVCGILQFGRFAHEPNETVTAEGFSTRLKSPPTTRVIGVERVKPPPAPEIVTE